MVQEFTEVNNRKYRPEYRLHKVFKVFERELIFLKKVTDNQIVSSKNV